jgi:PAS domain S-box-containing protein
MTFQDSIDPTHSRYYRRIVILVAAFAAFYSALYFVYEVFSSGWGLLLNVVVLAWIFQLDIKGRHTLSRHLFFVSCCLCISSTYFGISQKLNVEMYLLPLMLLPFLMFGVENLKRLSIMTAVPIVLWWLFQMGFVPHIESVSEAVLGKFPLGFVNSVNAMGAFFVSGFFVIQFVKHQKALRLDYDARWCKMVGLPESEITPNYELWKARVHPDDLAAAQKASTDHIEGRTSSYENIHRMRHADGHWMWTLDRGRITERGSNGEPLRFSGTQVDITKIIETERQLEEAQSVAKIGSWTFDTKTQMFNWSKEMYKIFPVGSVTGSLRPDVMFRFIHPEDLKKVTAVLQNDLPMGVSFRILFRAGDSGQWKWVEAIGNAESRVLNSTGMFHGTCQDVTERVQVDEEYRYILEALGVGIWKFNPVTQNLFWDKSMYNLYGVREEDFTGHYSAWESCLTAESKAEAVEELQKALRGEKEFNTTFEIQDSRGVFRSIGGSGKVIRDNLGNAVMMYGLNWDKTIEVQLIKALEVERLKTLHTSKLASLGEMASSVAHEINNPLTVISANAAMLLLKVTDDLTIRSKLEAVMRSVDRITKIVNGLRKFSRTTDEKEIRPTELSKILNEALVLTTPKARVHDVKVKLVSGDSCIVDCDEIDLEQVLVNLINNSIDACKDLTSRWVEIETKNEKDKVVLTITDSGSGIPESIANKVFEPFFTTKGIGEGTGLGMSIAKGILEDHGATIEIIKNFPHTRFEICFKRSQSTTKAAQTMGWSKLRT